MEDSMIATASGQGKIDMRKVADMASKWGKLPEKERAEAMRELTRDLPPELRETVERFFKELTARGAQDR